MNNLVFFFDYITYNYDVYIKKMYNHLNGKTKNEKSSKIMVVKVLTDLCNGFKKIVFDMSIWQKLCTSILYTIINHTPLTFG